MTFTPWARMTVNCTRVEPGGRGHVETTHKLLCFFIRIRMFVQINLRHIKYKMSRQVSACSPGFAFGHKHFKLKELTRYPFFFEVFVLMRSSSLPYDPPPPPSSAKTLTTSNLYLKLLPKSRVNQRSTRFPRSEDRAVISVNILHEQPSGTLERCRFFHQK